MTARRRNPEPAPRGRPRRSAEAAAEERARILAVAQRLFARDGYEGVSMRAVAKEAGCSPAALYTLFPNKRALLRGIWEEAFLLLGDTLEKSAKGARDSVGRLKRLGCAFIRFWLDHPDHFRAIFLIEDRVSGPGDIYFVDSSESLVRLARLFRGAVTAAIAEGALGRHDMEETVQLLFCGLHGTASALISIPEFGWKAPGRLPGRMTDTLLAGLAAR